MVGVHLLLFIICWLVIISREVSAADGVLCPSSSLSSLVLPHAPEVTSELGKICSGDRMSRVVQDYEVVRHVSKLLG